MVGALCHTPPAEGRSQAPAFSSLLGTRVKRQEYSAWSSAVSYTEEAH